MHIRTWLVAAALLIGASGCAVDSQRGAETRRTAEPETTAQDDVARAVRPVLEGRYTWFRADVWLLGKPGPLARVWPG